MKRDAIFGLLVLVATGLQLACHSPGKAPAPAPLPPEIHFEVDLPGDECQDFENGVCPYVGMESPEVDIAKLRQRDAIVLARRRAIVVIDYPLGRPVEVAIVAPTDAGFSRAELARAISREYHRIYAEEEATAPQKTIPLEQRGKVINRNQTNGKYHICCHDLGDLVLHTVEVSERLDGTVVLGLGIDS